MLRILGVDPGTRVVGWGVLEARGNRLVVLGHGAIRAPASLPVADRLARLARELARLVAQHRPTEAAVEEAFHGRDARSALKIGEGRGAVLAVLATEGLRIAGYANNVVKKAVSGGGRAGKERVQAMVARILGLTRLPEPFDAADALAVAICHWQRRGAARTAPGIAPRLAAAIAAAKSRDAGKQAAATR
jgi:crossover junction endodeoxyribonuclease RuvC